MEGQNEHGGVHCNVDGNGFGKYFPLDKIGYNLVTKKEKKNTHFCY